MNSLYAVNKRNFRYLLFSLAGFFCSNGGVFALKIGNSSLAISNILYFAILFLGLMDRKIYLLKSKLIIYAFLIEMIISSVVADNSLRHQAMLVTAKFVVVIFGMTLFFNNAEMKKNARAFLNGFYYNAICQMVWSWAETILYYFFHFRLNDFFFRDILKIAEEHDMTFVQYGILRPTGFGWEPANLALVLAIGLVLSNKPKIKGLFAMSLLLTTSLTGILLLGTIIGLNAISLVRKKRVKRKSLYLGIVATFLAIVGIVCAAKFMPSIYKVVTGRIINILSGSKKDSSANVHMAYYYIAPMLLFSKNLITILFGFGTFLGGVVLSTSGVIYEYLAHQLWNPESDFVTILLGNGLVGIILYYCAIFKTLILKKRQKQLFNICVLIAISGITYIYFRSTWAFLMMALLSFKDEHMNLEENHNEFTF